jgi:hypothetical protein
MQNDNGVGKETRSTGREGNTEIKTMEEREDTYGRREKQEGTQKPNFSVTINKTYI